MIVIVRVSDKQKKEKLVGETILNCKVINNI